MKHTFFANFHCILPSKEQQLEIEKLIDQIISKELQNSLIDKQCVENEIDKYI